MHVRFSFNVRRLLFAAFALFLLTAPHVTFSNALTDDSIGYQGGGELAGPTYTTYVVRYGDTLAIIAARFRVSLATLMSVNGIRNANMIYAGQVLRIPLTASKAVVPPPPPVGPTRDAPDEKLIPDSEAVYSPAYANFDVDAAVQKFGGYLAAYRQEVDGETLTGAQIVQLIAERFSVGPRLLLTMLEMQSGWVTGRPSNAQQQDSPMNIEDRYHTGLYYQVWHAANALNTGYYGRLLSRQDVVGLKDNSRIRFGAKVNPGTAGVQSMLARGSNNYDQFVSLIGANGFKATYQKLFGDPFANAIEPIVPADLKQPTLRLPFADGQTWYYTGGPHGAWADGSAWAAVDFAPLGPGGCPPSAAWAIAVAPGKVAQVERGRVMLNLDGEDFQGKGWTIMYMHMHSNGRVQKGALLNTGDRIGHPSCEGGYALGTHLHIARMYNGQWLAVASQSPFVMSGWQFNAQSREYDGTMVRNDVRRLAVNGHVDRLNGVTADAGSVAERGVEITAFALYNIP